MRPAALLPIASVFASVLACGPAAPPSSPTSGGSAAQGAGISSSSLATPGPAAAACTDDAACGQHRCNTAAGKCAFPCVSDADCVAGASCVHGAVAACLEKH